MADRKTETLAILFADVAKSTHLYEKLGDKVARALIGKCIYLLSGATFNHSGTVIKTIGDEVMCTFPTANEAVDAAIEMHKALEGVTIDEKPGFPPPNIYVGIHMGPVISEGGDVFGDAVNVAARMVSMAKQRQIVTTEETVKVLAPEHQEKAHVVDKTTIKGKSGEVNIYELVWEEQDVTVMMDDAVESPALKARMELRYHDTVLELDDSRPTATLGRQPHNDVVVNDNRVSRSHARIEYRRGKFVLVDQSSNGTYALIQGKKDIVLKRDEAPLLGYGIIGLGKEPDESSPDVIKFTIKM